MFCRHVVVAWDACCLPKATSALGLKNIFNEALLSKFTWKFLTNDSLVFLFF